MTGRAYQESVADGSDPSDGVSYERQRDRLVVLLDKAAELEQTVCCQYLFSAFSMRTAPLQGVCTWDDVEAIRNWRATMLSIARQEMEHLAIVNNLLTALGEAPFFQRSTFPIAVADSFTGLPFDLQRFTLESLGWYVLYELPATPNQLERDFIAFLQQSPLPQDKKLANQFANERKIAKRSIVALYDEIEGLVKTLGAPGGPPLFIGPPAAQVGNAAVMPLFPPRPDNVRTYDVLIAQIFDLPTAVTALEQIRSEGEGSKTPTTPTGGHFVEFVGMYKELSLRTQAMNSFDPSRPVVSNPRASESATSEEDAAVTTVTNPATVAAMELYDHGYSICLKLLTRFFASSDPAELPVLQDVVFFPMMTLLLRPLGDMITEMPVGTVIGPVAGPSFVPPYDVGLQPHPEAAFIVLNGELQELSNQAAAIAARTDLDPELQPRFQFLAENMWRLAYNFANKSNFGIPT
jgi:hypothetical protein